MDATRGTLVIPKSAAAASAGDNTTAVTRPARPAMLPKITPGVSGATNNARPVASVFNRSPFENVTSTPGVSLPFTSRTANVARSPETICRGSSKIRAPDANGAAGVLAVACCAFAFHAPDGAEIITHQISSKNTHRKNIHLRITAIVVETAKPAPEKCRKL